MCTEEMQVGLQLIINDTGVKEQFRTAAFAVIHASAMSCDNTRILMPNTQYSTAQAPFLPPALVSFLFADKSHSVKTITKCHLRAVHFS